MSRWIVCSLGAVLVWGIWGLVFSMASGMMPPLMVLVIETAGMAPIVAALFFTKNVRKGGRIGRGTAWAVFTGIGGALANVTFSEAIVRGGEASIITPLTAMYPLVTVVLAAAFLRERINVVQGLGIGAALVAIVLFNGADGTVDAGVLSASLAAPWMPTAIVSLVLMGIVGISQK